MGVDCKLFLYRSAEPQDVANALSILAGNPVDRELVGESRTGSGFYVPRPRVSLKAVGVHFGMGAIAFDSPVDPAAPQGHLVHIHATGEHGFGWQLLPRSTPFWVAACRRLVDVFGGALDHDDCDDSPVDYFRFEEAVMGAKDDEGFHERMARIMELKPLTAGEIEACQGLAAYKAEAGHHAAP
jgi:hypothetical protein